MTGKQDIRLIFFAQIRAQEWYYPEYVPEQWTRFDVMIFDEIKRTIIMFVDVKQLYSETKIILSLN